MALVWTLAAAYVGVGVLYVQRDLRRAATVESEVLCSDQCRERVADIRERSIALAALPPALAALIHMVAGLKWPIVLLARCPFYRQGARRTCPRRAAHLPSKGDRS